MDHDCQGLREVISRFFLICRSSQWPKVRAEHLKNYPTCEICGTREGLQVHHVASYSQHPEKECDPGNLATLCGPAVNNCHFIFGHLFNWRRVNPDFRLDADIWKGKVND